MGRLLRWRPGCEFTTVTAHLDLCQCRALEVAISRAILVALLAAEVERCVEIDEHVAVVRLDYHRRHVVVAQVVDRVRPVVERDRLDVKTATFETYACRNVRDIVERAAILAEADRVRKVQEGAVEGVPKDVLPNSGSAKFGIRQARDPPSLGSAKLGIRQAWDQIAASDRVAAHACAQMGDRLGWANGRSN